MNKGEARFVTSVAEPGALPWPQGPEVVFTGRSNVGKSSLINAVVRSRGLARVSRTPGRTRLINFFEAPPLGILVDLPGYGFARVPERVRAQWKPLVDARHPPTDQDVQMMAWLRQASLPARVVLTKSDAVAASRMAATVRCAAERLQLDAADGFPLPVSARTGKGIEEVRALIHRAVST